MLGISCILTHLIYTTPPFTVSVHMNEMPTTFWKLRSILGLQWWMKTDTASKLRKLKNQRKLKKSQWSYVKVHKGLGGDRGPYILTSQSEPLNTLSSESMCIKGGQAFIVNKYDQVWLSKARGFFPVILSCLLTIIDRFPEDVFPF